MKFVGIPGAAINVGMCAVPAVSWLVPSFDTAIAAAAGLGIPDAFVAQCKLK
jgi:hypothetical protein